jgi:hypothetical protein
LLLDLVKEGVGLVLSPIPLILNVGFIEPI